MCIPISLSYLLRFAFFRRQDLWPEVEEAMLERSLDKVATIRAQSVYALKHLQQPELEKDAVTAALLRLAVTDTNKYVLQFILVQICK